MQLMSFHQILQFIWVQKRDILHHLGRNLISVLSAFVLLVCLRGWEVVT